MNARSFLLSALIGGAVIGLLGNLPVLNLINCCLCIWVWLGGFLTVHFYRRFQKGGPGLTIGLGAGLGAAAGLIGAFVGVIVNAAMSFISMPLYTSLARYFELEGDLQFLSGVGRSLIVSLLFYLIIDALLYPLFGALSGLLTVSLIKKEPQA